MLINNIFLEAEQLKIKENQILSFPQKAIWMAWKYVKHVS